MKEIYLSRSDLYDKQPSDGTFSVITKASELPPIIQLYQYNSDTSKSKLHGTIFCSQNGTTNTPDPLGFMIQFMVINDNTKIQSLKNIVINACNYPISAEYIINNFNVLKITDYSAQSMSPFFEDFVPEVYTDKILKDNKYRDNSDPITLDCVAILKSYTNKLAYILIEKNKYEKYKYMILHPKRLLKESNLAYNSSMAWREEGKSIYQTYRYYFNSECGFDESLPLKKEDNERYSTKHPLTKKYLDYIFYKNNNNDTTKSLVNKQGIYFDGLNNKILTSDFKNAVYKLYTDSDNIMLGKQYNNISENVYDYTYRTKYSFKVDSGIGNTRFSAIFNHIPNLNKNYDVFYCYKESNTDIKYYGKTNIYDTLKNNTIYAQVYCDSKNCEDFDSEDRFTADKLPGIDITVTDNIDYTIDGTLNVTVSDNSITFPDKKHVLSFYINKELTNTYIMCRGFPIPLECQRIYEKLWRYYIPRAYIKADTRKTLFASIERCLMSSNLIDSLDNVVYFTNSISSDTDVKVYYFDYIYDDTTSVKRDASIDTDDIVTPFNVRGDLLTYSDEKYTPLNIVSQS